MSPSGPYRNPLVAGVWFGLVIGSQPWQVGALSAG